MVLVVLSLGHMLPRDGRWGHRTDRSYTHGTQMQLAWYRQFTVNGRSSRRGTRGLQGAGDSLRSHVVSSHRTAVDISGRTQLQGSTRLSHQRAPLAPLPVSPPAPPPSHYQHYHSHHHQQPPARPHPPQNSPSHSCGGGHVRIHHRRSASAPGLRLLPWRTHNLVRPLRSRPSYLSLTNLHKLVRLSGRGYWLALLSTKLLPSGAIRIGWSGFHALCLLGPTYKVSHSRHTHPAVYSQSAFGVTSEGSLGGGGSITAAPEGPDD